MQINVFILSHVVWTLVLNTELNSILNQPWTTQNVSKNNLPSNPKKSTKLDLWVGMNHNIKIHFQNKINKWETWKLGPITTPLPHKKRKKLQASQIIFLIHHTWQKIIQIEWGNNIWHTSFLETLLHKHGKSSQSIIQEINKHLFYLKMFSKMFTTLLHNSFTLKHLKTKDICNLSGAVKYAPSTRVTSNTVYFQTWLSAAMPIAVHAERFSKNCERFTFRAASQITLPSEY